MHIKKRGFKGWKPEFCVYIELSPLLLEILQAYDLYQAVKEQNQNSQHCVQSLGGVSKLFFRA